MREHTKMPDSEYFALKAASNSLLKSLDCPARALIPFKPTKAMQLGTLVHCAVLEPDKFDSRYIVAPNINKRTKDGKEEWAEFVKSNNKEVISMEDSDTAHYIAKCVMAHPVAADLLTGGESERVFQWEDNTGVKCKSKADYVKGNDIIDLKTAADCSPQGFARACANFSYHMQDAHYSNGAECERFIFVVVETSYPFIVSVYELDEDAKDLGQRAIEDAMNRYIELNMFELWQDGYNDSQTITKLAMPAWLK